MYGENGGEVARGVPRSRSARFLPGRDCAASASGDVQAAGLHAVVNGVRTAAANVVEASFEGTAALVCSALLITASTAIAWGAYLAGETVASLIVLAADQIVLGIAAFIVLAIGIAAVNELSRD